MAEYQSDDCLVMFLEPSCPVRKEDIDVILRYGVPKVICVLYGYSEPMLDDLERRLRNLREPVGYIEAAGPEDPNVEMRIRNVAVSVKGTVCIDIMNASQFHAAAVMNLGGSGRVEIWKSSYDGDGCLSIVRMDRRRHIYYGLTDTCYLILDIMAERSKVSIEALAEALNPGPGKDPKMCRKGSVIYEMCEKMASWGLIYRCSGEAPEGYRSRTLHFYAMNADQCWDYFSYRADERRRRADRAAAKRRKSQAADSKRESKMLGKERRRKSPRRKISDSE